MDVFILLKEKKSSRKSLSSLKLLRLLIGQQSQKVLATIKGFVRVRAATNRRKGYTYLGRRVEGARAQEGRREGGDEEGGLRAHLR